MSPTSVECPDGTWTTGLERRFQRTWSSDDDELLQSSKQKEASLWVACHAIFGSSPPEILPENMTVDTICNRPMRTKDGRQLKSINWSDTLCNEFSKIIKCPIFCKDLWFLRYTLRYTLLLRLGMTNGPGEPAEPEFNRDMASDITNDLTELVKDPKLREQMIKHIPMVTERITARHRAQNHPHIGLIEVIKGIVKAGNHKKSTGIIIKDIQCIMEAWRVYATANNLPRSVQILLHRSGNLPRDEEERRQAINLREFDFHGAKKTYILSRRRTAAEADGGWKRGAEARFGEAVEIGKDYLAEGGSDDDDDDGGADDSGSDHDGLIENGSVRDGFNGDGSDRDGSDHSDSFDHNNLASERSEIARAPEESIASQGVIANLRRKLVPDGRETANKRLRSDPEHVPANDDQSREQSAAKPIEDARNLWNELVPGFSLLSIPTEEPSLTTYNDMLPDSAEAWQSEKGGKLWAAASAETKTTIIDQLMAVENHFDSITNREVQDEVEYGKYFISDIREYLQGRMEESSS